MTWFIGIFTDILGTCGMLLGGIIVAVLAVFMAVCWLFIGWLAVSFVFASIYAAIYYWPRQLYYKLKGIQAPPDPVAAWANRKAHDINAWMKGVIAWMEKKRDQAAEEAEAQKWKS